MLTTTISFVIVLGILIFIHELGHFAIAKFSGVGVEKFSLGFGPKLVGVKVGETEYRLSLLPLGGYVKMVGEHSDTEMSEEDKKRSFTHKRVTTRAFIVSAGPIMNLVLAIVLFPLVYMIGVQVPTFMKEPVQIGYVVEEAPADEAGLKTGDHITAVDGKRVESWEGFLTTLTLSPDTSMEVTYERDGREKTTTVVTKATKETGGGYAGILPPMRPVIGDLSRGYPAEEAGLASGDVILSVDGHRISHWADLERFIQKDGRKRTFVVGRGGEELSFEITPKLNEEMNVFLIGVTRQDTLELQRYGFVESVGKGVYSAVDMTGRLFMVLKGLVVGQYSLKTLGGPIMIAQVAGQAAESGLADIISLMAFLSLQLGIINLFPIPVLDGGHLMFYVIEAVKGKPLSERFMGVAQQVGFALLIALMVLVTYNDIFRIFG